MFIIYRESESQQLIRKLMHHKNLKRFDNVFTNVAKSGEKKIKWANKYQKHRLHTTNLKDLKSEKRDNNRFKIKAGSKLRHTKTLRVPRAEKSSPSRLLFQK